MALQGRLGVQAGGVSSLSSRDLAMAVLHLSVLDDVATAELARLELAAGDRADLTAGSAGRGAAAEGAEQAASDASEAGTSTKAARKDGADGAGSAAGGVTGLAPAAGGVSTAPRLVVHDRSVLRYLRHLARPRRIASLIAGQSGAVSDDDTCKRLTNEQRRRRIAKRRARQQQRQRQEHHRRDDRHQRQQTSKPGGEEAFAAVAGMHRATVDGDREGITSAVTAGATPEGTRRAAGEGSAGMARRSPQRDRGGASAVWARGRGQLDEAGERGSLGASDPAARERGAGGSGSMGVDVSGVLDAVMGDLSGVERRGAGFASFRGQSFSGAIGTPMRTQRYKTDASLLSPAHLHSKLLMGRDSSLLSDAGSPAVGSDDAALNSLNSSPTAGLRTASRHAEPVKQQAGSAASLFGFLASLGGPTPSANSGITPSANLAATQRAQDDVRVADPPRTAASRPSRRRGLLKGATLVGDTAVASAASRREAGRAARAPSNGRSGLTERGAVGSTSFASLSGNTDSGDSSTTDRLAAAPFYSNLGGVGSSGTLLGLDTTCAVSSLSADGFPFHASVAAPPALLDMRHPQDGSAIGIADMARRPHAALSLPRAPMSAAASLAVPGAIGILQLAASPAGGAALAPVARSLRVRPVSLLGAFESPSTLAAAWPILAPTALVAAEPGSHVLDGPPCVFRLRVDRVWAALCGADWACIEHTLVQQSGASGASAGGGSGLNAADLRPHMADPRLRVLLALRVDKLVPPSADEPAASVEHSVACGLVTGWINAAPYLLHAAVVAPQPPVPADAKTASRAPATTLGAGYNKRALLGAPSGPQTLTHARSVLDVTAARAAPAADEHASALRQSSLAAPSPIQLVRDDRFLSLESGNAGRAAASAEPATDSWAAAVFSPTLDGAPGAPGSPFSLHPQPAPAPAGSSLGGLSLSLSTTPRPDGMPVASPILATAHAAGGGASRPEASGGDASAASSSAVPAEAVPAKSSSIFGNIFSVFGSSSAAKAPPAAAAVPPAAVAGSAAAGPPALPLHDGEQLEDKGVALSAPSSPRDEHETEDGRQPSGEIGRADSNSSSGVFASMPLSPVTASLSSTARAGHVVLHSGDVSGTGLERAAHETVAEAGLAAGDVSPGMCVDAAMGAFALEEREEHSLRPSSEQLELMGLQTGKNVLEFTVDATGAKVECNLFLWKTSDKVVISDVDGTITKSDAMGHIAYWVGADWTQEGVASFFANIHRNGYKIVYLTSRAIGQVNSTRDYLHKIAQDDVPAPRQSTAGSSTGNAAALAVTGAATAAAGGSADGTAASTTPGSIATVDLSKSKLPPGPVITSPDRLFAAFTREVIQRKPQQFKIAALSEIRNLFPLSINPFYAGFGNRDTDEISYAKVGVPKSRIFIIDTSGNISQAGKLYCHNYSGLNKMVDLVFPTIDTSSSGAFSGAAFHSSPTLGQGSHGVPASAGHPSPVFAPAMPGPARRSRVHSGQGSALSGSEDGDTTAKPARAGLAAVPSTRRRGVPDFTDPNYSDASWWTMDSRRRVIVDVDPRNPHAAASTAASASAPAAEK